MRTVDATDLARLHAEALASENRRSRILLHASHGDTIQEMCIGLMRSSVIHPHRQLNRSKSYCVVVGSIEVLFFGDDGDVRKTLHMQAQGGAHPFVLRFDASVWHTVSATSDWAVYLEVIEGPHEATTTQWLTRKCSAGESYTRPAE